MAGVHRKLIPEILSRAHRKGNNNLYQSDDEKLQVAAFDAWAFQKEQTVLQLSTNCGCYNYRY